MSRVPYIHQKKNLIEAHRGIKKCCELDEVKKWKKDTMIPDDECKSVPKTTRSDVCYMKLNLFVFFFSFCTRGDDYGACRYVENVGGYVILHSHFCLCFMHLFQNLNTLAIFFSFSPSASFKVKAKENLLNLLNQYIIIVNMKFVSN